MTFTIECDEAKRKFGRDQHSGTIDAPDGTTLFGWHMAIEEPASEKSLNGGTVRELRVWGGDINPMEYDEGWVNEPSSALQKQVLAKLLEWAE